jgi:CheY-like chemotaxis protein
MNILIVEDDQVLMLTMQRMVKELNHSIHGVAARGSEAVEKALSGRCDLILMDIMLLGDMDGIEAYEKIKKQRNIPVIYTTGNSDSLNRNRAKEHGYHAFLTKPVSFLDLKSAIESLGNPG